MNPRTEIPSDNKSGKRRARPMSAASNATILAKDIMTTSIVTVEPATTVRQIALLLAEKHISAVPVVDHGALLGIVSEGDLIHRRELGTATERGPWSDASDEPETVKANHAKSHGMHARDVMTRDVVTVSEDTSLVAIARTFEARRVKRVPVMRGARLVGIVSRANIVRALATRPEGSPGPAGSDDDMIRYKVIETLMGIPGTSPWATTVTVTNRVVELGGGVEEEASRDRSRIAVENLPYVIDVKDHRAILQPY